MKTIGLIGGSSWHSTIDYYRLLNQAASEKLGGHHSARIVIYSIDLDDMVSLGLKGDWEGVGKMLSGHAHSLELAGAACIGLCANTMHMVYDAITQNVQIPVIHIAEVTAAEAFRMSYKKVGLLGTAFTMDAPFFPSNFSKAGIEVIVPEPRDRGYIQRSIVDELTKGIFTDEARLNYKNIIQKLKEAGAEAVILGCTEIPMLLKADESALPFLDTTAIHAKALSDFALN